MAFHPYRDSSPATGDVITPGGVLVSSALRSENNMERASSRISIKRGLLEKLSMCMITRKAILQYLQ